MQNSISYLSKYPLYALSFYYSSLSDDNEPYYLACGSMNESFENNIEIIATSPVSILNNNDDSTHNSNFHLNIVYRVDVGYPTTKLSFSKKNPNLLAATSNELVLYNFNKQEQILTIAQKFTPPKNENNFNGQYHYYNNGYNSVFTSIAWSNTNPFLVGTTSTDSFCTLFDLSSNKEKERFKANTNEAYDICFSLQDDSCYICGEDGCVRFFDYRTKPKHKIIFKMFDNPILKCCVNPMDTNYLLFVPLNHKDVYICDIRNPNTIYKQLSYHTENVTSAFWLPNSTSKLVSVSDDKRVVKWDMNNEAGNEAYQYCLSGFPINNCSVNEYDCNWMAITGKNCLKFLKV